MYMYCTFIMYMYCVVCTCICTCTDIHVQGWGNSETIAGHSITHSIHVYTET